MLWFCRSSQGEEAETKKEVRPEEARFLPLQVFGEIQTAVAASVAASPGEETQIHPERRQIVRAASAQAAASLLRRPVQQILLWIPSLEVCDRPWALSWPGEYQSLPNSQRWARGYAVIFPPTARGSYDNNDDDDEGDSDAHDDDDNDDNGEGDGMEMEVMIMMLMMMTTTMMMTTMIMMMTMVMVEVTIMMLLMMMMLRLWWWRWWRRRRRWW